MFSIYDFSPVLKTTLTQYSKVLHKQGKVFLCFISFFGCRVGVLLDVHILTLLDCTRGCTFSLYISTILHTV